MADLDLIYLGKALHFGYFSCIFLKFFRAVILQYVCNRLIPIATDCLDFCLVSKRRYKIVKMFRLDSTLKENGYLDRSKPSCVLQTKPYKKF